MDPFTAFSLACGIIQVVDFSAKVVNMCRELYKEGSVSENEDVEEMAKHLTDLRTNLDLTDHGSGDEIFDLVSKCSSTAQELVAELQKMKVNEPHRKRQVVSKTIKALWKRSAIEEIQDRLDDYRRLLDTRILVNLRNRFHLSALQQSEGFQNLDLRVQTIITKLSQSPQSFEELKALIHVENGSIKGHITKELQQHRRGLAHEHYCQRFVESLWYPEIHRRQETVGEAHQKTFQWIYEPDGFNTSARRWDNFIEWLEKAGGIYWINGKAGSGKSTLMNYIYQDDRTANLLRVWSGAKAVFIPSFFFWNAGTPLEKSSEGLLRSLLYQILQKFPSLTPLSCESQSALGAANDSLQKCEPIAVWTERRLRTTFESVMRQAQESCCICVFIDGLDELSGDQDKLISFIETLPRANVKVCLSSRPYRIYSNAFGASAKLQLQDLTETDIRAYASDELRASMRKMSENDVLFFVNTIVDKADGVFLWVELVVKDIITGLGNDDTLKELEHRLELMPADIEDLYTHMLSTISRVYQKLAAELFQMALLGLTGSLLNVALALFRESQGSQLSMREAIASSETARRRIPTICAGLLEVHLEDKNSEECLGRRVGNWCCASIAVR